MPDLKRQPEHLLLAEQGRQFFHHQIQVMKTCLARLDAGQDDPELIHDLRVAARRFTSLVRQTEPFLDARWCRQAAKTVHPVRKVTNRLRDASVLVERLASMPAEQVSGQDVADLADWLGHEQRKHLEKARLKLLDEKFRRKLDQLDDFLSAPAAAAHLLRAEPTSRDLYALHSIEDVRSALLFCQTAKLLALRQLIVAESELPAEVLADPVLAAGFLEVAPDVIHRIRLSAKDFRYVLEFLAPVLQSEPLAAWLDSFRALQDQLGAIHDLDLAQERITRLEKCGPDRKLSQEWLDLCAALKRAWREERQTLLDRLQPQWSDWTAERYECKIYELIFQKSAQSDVMADPLG